MSLLLFELQIDYFNQDILFMFSNVKHSSQKHQL